MALRATANGPVWYKNSFISPSSTGEKVSVPSPNLTYPVTFISTNLDESCLQVCFLLAYG